MIEFDKGERGWGQKPRGAALFPHRIRTAVQLLQCSLEERRVRSSFFAVRVLPIHAHGPILSPTLVLLHPALKITNLLSSLLPRPKTHREERIGVDAMKRQAVLYHTALTSAGLAHMVSGDGNASFLRANQLSAEAARPEVRFWQVLQFLDPQLQLQADHHGERYSLTQLLHTWQVGVLEWVERGEHSAPALNLAEQDMQDVDRRRGYQLPSYSQNAHNSNTHPFSQSTGGPALGFPQLLPV